MRGLQELGYDVMYLERQNRSGEYYDPATGSMTDDTGYACSYVAGTLDSFGVRSDRWALVDLGGDCHGCGWGELRATLDRADFVLLVADATWLDELERCERRAFVDGDPVFTQAAMLSGNGASRGAPAHCPVLFTYGTRIGAADCTVPDAGRRWLPTRPVVATDLWRPSAPDPRQPVTALMHWAAGRDVVIAGRSYGHKDRELERLIELPRRAPDRFVLAVGGKRAPRDRLATYGWELEDPLASTITLDAYRAFIARSRADLGIAKHAYVTSRSGWFSDRSTCFLAAARPVLHQDTGCGDWLPSGDGVLLFSDLDDLVGAIKELDRDYERHARAARRVAEEHFEARTVIGSMLDEAGFR